MPTHPCLRGGRVCTPIGQPGAPSNADPQPAEEPLGPHRAPLCTSPGPVRGVATDGLRAHPLASRPQGPARAPERLYYTGYEGYYTGYEGYYTGEYGY